MEYDMRKDCQIQVFKEGGKWLTEDGEFLFVLHKTEDETETVSDFDDFLEGQTTKCPKVFFLYQSKISSGALYEADEHEMTILF